MNRKPVVFDGTRKREMREGEDTIPITLLSGVVGLGLHAMTLPVVTFTPRITSGPAGGILETATNKVMAQYLAFDPTSAEYAQTAFQLPKSWDGGTILVAFVWMHPATATNFGVAWQARAVALADGNDLETAFGSSVTVTDTGGSTNRVYITARSGALTMGNSPSPEDWIILEANRNPGDAGDTMAVDAYLLGVMVYINVTASTDA